MKTIIVSPNTVLANTLNKTVDLLRPRIAYRRPKKIVFIVGTQINGPPHIGTNLVQCCAFLLAQESRHIFSVDTSVKFGALDNAPYEVKLDPESYHAYQITFYHALGEEEITSLINSFYNHFFEGLSERTDVEYHIETYTEQQHSAEFRLEFFKTLKHKDKISWNLSPSSGVVHIRIPCAECFWAEKRAERTKLLHLSDEVAIFEAFCYDHMSYKAEISLDSSLYLDLNTIYRNVIKEAICTRDPDTLYVMVKGGDWVFGCQPVDWALSILGYKSIDLPVRIFTPQVLMETGAKLSKSLIKQGDMKIEEEAGSWMLETGNWKGDKDEYIDILMWLVENLMSDPKHFFRSYCYEEIERIMKEHPPIPINDKNIRVMRIYKKYFQMIANGEKTIEIRVGYSSMKKIKPDQFIKFVCQDDECLTRVVRINSYNSFKELYEHEDLEKVNPHASLDEQLTELSKIFPPHKETLGVLAIEITRQV